MKINDIVKFVNDVRGSDTKAGEEVQIMSIDRERNSMEVRFSRDNIDRSGGIYRIFTDVTPVEVVRHDPIYAFSFNEDGDLGVQLDTESVHVRAIQPYMRIDVVLHKPDNDPGSFMAYIGTCPIAKIIKLDEEVTEGKYLVCFMAGDDRKLDTLEEAVAYIAYRMEP